MLSACKDRPEWQTKTVCKYQSHNATAPLVGSDTLWEGTEQERNVQVRITKMNGSFFEAVNTKLEETHGALQGNRRRLIKTWSTDEGGRAN